MIYKSDRLVFFIVLTLCLVFSMVFLPLTSHAGETSVVVQYLDICSQQGNNSRCVKELDLTGDGRCDTEVTLLHTLSPLQETEVVIQDTGGVKQPYSMVITGARLELMAVTSLRDEGARELLLAWRMEGSGGYLSYVVLEQGEEGFREMLRVEGLFKGAVSLSQGLLEHSEFLVEPGFPNTMPAAVEKTWWHWNGSKFIPRVTVQELDNDFFAAVEGGHKYKIKAVEEDGHDYLEAMSMPNEVAQKITEKALEMNVPPVLVKAIAMVESGGRHYWSCGTVKRGGAGEIGLMQIYPCTHVFTPEELKRLEDLDYNIEVGIKMLIEKKMYSGSLLPMFVEPGNHQQINMHDDIMESWYFAVWAYNGWVHNNIPGYREDRITYQDRVINHVKNMGSAMEAVPEDVFTCQLPARGELFPLPGKNNGGLKPLEQGKEARVVNTSTLNVREMPATVFGTDRERVGIVEVLREAERVILLEGPHTNNNNRWYRVGFTEQDAYSRQGWAAKVQRTSALNFIKYLTWDSPVVPVSSVSLNKKTLTLVQGTTEILAATVSPANATNKTVTWSSSDSSAVAVSSNGTVTAVSAGTATITVTTADGNYTANCVVTVTPVQDIPKSVNIFAVEAYEQHRKTNLGDEIRIYAVAEGYTNPVYQFFVRTPGDDNWDMQPAQAYSENNHFTFSDTNQEGRYYFVVWVKEAGTNGQNIDPLGRGGYDRYAWTPGYPYLIGNTPIIRPGQVSLEAVPASGKVSQPITLQANNTSGANAEYRFYVKTPGGEWKREHPERDYGHSNIFTYIPEQPGDYAFSVWARAKGAIEEYDDWNWIPVYTVE